MENIVEDIVDDNDLKKFELLYHDQVRRGHVSEKTEFDYAWCLIKSRYKQDMQKGAALLEELFQKSRDETAKRDYLYFLSVAYTRLKEYDRALKYVKAILKIEPSNKQAVELQSYIENKMKKEGLVGMAIVGGAAALALGGILGIGFALSKKS